MSIDISSSSNPPVSSSTEGNSGIEKSSKEESRFSCVTSSKPESTSSISSSEISGISKESRADKSILSSIPGIVKSRDESSIFSWVV